jgi:hypothetical protein
MPGNIDRLLQAFQPGDTQLLFAVQLQFLKLFFNIR